MKRLLRILKISLVITIIVIAINLVFSDFELKYLMDVKTLGIFFFDFSGKCMFFQLFQ